MQCPNGRGERKDGSAACEHYSGMEAVLSLTPGISRGHADTGSLFFSTAWYNAGIGIAIVKAQQYSLLSGRIE